MPQTTVPGERTSPTQPFPTKPPPFAEQGITEDQLIDYTPELKAKALEIVSEYDIGPLFTPPTEKGLIMAPADGGGANWMGAAADPETGIVYVPSSSYSAMLKLAQPDPNRSDMRYYVAAFTGYVPGPDDLPLTKPPYSRITAIDLNTGDHAWMTPVGQGLEDHPLLKDMNLPPTGGGWTAYPMATKTLLIAARDNLLRAYDKATGELLARVELNGADGEPLGRVSGAPMTYMNDGKQFIVVAVTGEDAHGSLVALALP